MPQSTADLPTDGDLRQAAEHHVFVKMGASNGRWWDGKHHCSSPAVEADDLARAMMALRDGEIAWREKTDRYSVTCLKDPATFQRFRPETVSFVVQGNIALDIRVEHFRIDGKPEFRFSGHTRPADVLKDMSHRVRGEYTWDPVAKLGTGTIQSEWKPDQEGG